MVVLKTVATATKTKVPTGDMSVSSALAPTPEDSVAPEPKMVAGFRSSLSLTTASATTADDDTEESSPRLKKARNSALRLSSVLHHKSPVETSDANLGIRKVRSVKWDTPIQPPKLGGALAPSPKKPRKAVNAAKLKSFKSFGRAHAEDFNSGPRNATFAEFARPQFWGRNGRLAVHPKPRNAGATDMMGQPERASTNAVFDLNRTNAPFDMSRPLGGSLTGASVAGAAQLNQGTSLPRSTTALEMFVLKKSTSGGKSQGMI